MPWSLTALAALAALAAAPAMPDAPSAGAVVEPVENPAPLVVAARTGDVGGIRTLLAANPHADVNQRTADGTSALHWAVYHNDVDTVDRLLAAGADPNLKNDYGATPMSEAAVVGNVKVLRALLAHKANAESANADGQSALMILARTSNVEAAQLLLRSGANVNACEHWRGQTPLMWAAAEGQPAMVRLLLKHHAAVDERSDVNEWPRQVTAEPRMQSRPSGGFTPLLYAARRGCLECARLLLGAGADKNLGDPDGVTPMLEAVLNFNFDIAALLIERKADVNRWDYWGRAPLYAAVDLNTLPIGGRADRPTSDRTSSLDLIKKLLDSGANPNLQLKLFPPYRSLRDDRGADTLLGVGTTPLLRAAKAGDLPAMKLLLSCCSPTGPTSSCRPRAASHRSWRPAGNGASTIDTRGRYKTRGAGARSCRAARRSRRGRQCARRGRPERSARRGGPRAGTRSSPAW